MLKYWKLHSVIAHVNEPLGKRKSLTPPEKIRLEMKGGGGGKFHSNFPLAGFQRLSSLNFLLISSHLLDFCWSAIILQFQNIERIYFYLILLPPFPIEIVSKALSVETIFLGVKLNSRNIYIFLAELSLNRCQFLSLGGIIGPTWIYFYLFLLSPFPIEIVSKVLSVKTVFLTGKLNIRHIYNFLW